MCLLRYLDNEKVKPRRDPGKSTNRGNSKLMSRVVGTSFFLSRLEIQLQ